jgi:F-type H+-transporting ATPase subunit g
MVLARPALRQSGRALGRTAARRFESSTASSSTTANKAAEAAKQNVSKAQSAAAENMSKAQQGLSRVASSAGPAITGAAKGLASSLSKVGGRTGKVVNFVEKSAPHVIYWFKVTAELSKLVFRGQKMQPPSVQTFQTYFQNAWKTVKNPTALMQTASQTASKASQQPASVMQQARNLNRAQVVAGGVVLAECLGFFTVGEMIGRFKVVGYHGETGAAHH